MTLKILKLNTNKFILNKINNKQKRYKIIQYMIKFINNSKMYLNKNNLYNKIKIR